MALPHEPVGIDETPAPAGEEGVTPAEDVKKTKRGWGFYQERAKNSGKQPKFRRSKEGPPSDEEPPATVATGEEPAKQKHAWGTTGASSQSGQPLPPQHPLLMRQRNVREQQQKEREAEGVQASPEPTRLRPEKEEPTRPDFPKQRPASKPEDDPLVADSKPPPVKI